MALKLPIRQRAGHKATWLPGAWTPVRCKKWLALDPSGKKRLSDWIDEEKIDLVCHEKQLPDWARG